MHALTRRLVLTAGLMSPIAAHAQVTEINFRIIPAEVTQNRRDEGAPFLAVGRAGGKVFVQKTDLDGTKGYYSLLIVSVASPFGSLDDLLRAAPGTLNLGTGDPTSTSGFLISGYYAWAKNNIDIRKFFKNVVSANYEPILLAVAHKQVDVATNNTEDLARFQKNQPARAANVHIIWQSPIIPTDPVVWRRDLPDDLKFTVESFFLTYGTDRAGADVAHERAIVAEVGMKATSSAAAMRSSCPSARWRRSRTS